MEMDIRPWGKYEVLLDTPNYKVKRITVKPGGCLSYQYHSHREEIWSIVSGTGLYTIDGVTQEAGYGQAIKIAKRAHHRIQNEKDEPLVFIEVQTGTYFGEDDIVRLEDVYDRDK